MRVVKQREGGIVRRVVLVDDHGDEVAPVSRFLSHLFDAGYSPNTVCAYGYDLRHLAHGAHQPVHGAPRDPMSAPVQLGMDLADPVDAVVLLVDPTNHFQALAIRDSAC